MSWSLKSSTKNERDVGPWCHVLEALSGPLSHLRVSQHPQGHLRTASSLLPSMPISGLNWGCSQPWFFRVPGPVCIQLLECYINAQEQKCAHTTPALRGFHSCHDRKQVRSREPWDHTHQRRRVRQGSLKWPRSRDLQNELARWKGQGANVPSRGRCESRDTEEETVTVKRWES